MLIAIDGPAASGKGTVAKMVAKKYGLEYLDTGRLYRAVALKVVDSWKMEVGSNKIDTSNFELQTLNLVEASKNITAQDLKGDRLETEEVGKYASIVSAIPEVRQNLFEFQRKVAKLPNGAVLDGRDIATVICPEADFKFFITADAKIRAKRRYDQLKLKNKDLTEEQVLNDILARDERDKGRKIAPLTVAEGAHYIDTSGLSIEEVFEKVCRIINM